jgi:hypothetical protein
MIFWAVATLAALVGTDADPSPVAFDEDVMIAQVQIQIQRSSIVRVPPVSALGQAAAAPKWKEKSAPSCVKWSNMAAAMISGPTTIDLIVRGGTRYRVKLEKSCSSIDFYSGFYVKATPDGEVCRDRDSIHSRSGGQCVIDTFKTLVPAK